MAEISSSENESPKSIKFNHHQESTQSLNAEIEQTAIPVQNKILKIIEESSSRFETNNNPVALNKNEQEIKLNNRVDGNDLKTLRNALEGITITMNAAQVLRQITKKQLLRLIDKIVILSKSNKRETLHFESTTSKSITLLASYKNKQTNQPNLTSIQLAA